MKNTKIVSTIGPSTDSKQKMAEIIDAGVDVVRLNFSHVGHEQHEEVFNRLRDVSEKTAAMIDTKGPEIRLGEIEEGTILGTGKEVLLTGEEIVGNSEKIPISYQGLSEHVEQGDEIRIDDGRIELEVLEAYNDIRCEVVFGGQISTRKAVNVPGKDIGLTAPTDKDIRDIEFAAEKGFDFVSISFVKSAEDVDEVREILERKGSDMQIISKIEHAKAVQNFDKILEVSDGIMVARGDLGVEVSASRLPALQKKIIEKSNKAGKPVITATEMLESMTKNPTATRAEISDVANAVMDGTDAVMLSGETAVGDYPVETVNFMAEVVEEVEKELSEEVHHTVKAETGSTAEIISKNIWQTAKEDNIKYIVAHTTSGSTARNIAKFRPEVPIVAFSDKPAVERQLQLVWGVHPYYEEFPGNVDEMLENSAERLRSLEMVEKTDKLVLSAGIPTNVPGTTNMLQIRSVKELIR
jgi:pyruvate kinase